MVLGIMSGVGMALGDPPADYGSIAAVGLFVALMCVCIIVGHLLEENRWMNESITALVIVSHPRLLLLILCIFLLPSVVVCWKLKVGGGLQGLGTGAVILFASSGKHSRVLVFSEDLFFIYLLPPIIFNAGYAVVFLAIDAMQRCCGAVVFIFLQDIIFCAAYT